LPVALKRLLLAESIVRTGQSLAEIFVVLYVTNVLGLSVTTFGSLVALRMALSIKSSVAPVESTAQRGSTTAC
jgi:hypothetical protein